MAQEADVRLDADHNGLAIFDYCPHSEAQTDLGSVASTWTPKFSRPSRTQALKTQKLSRLNKPFTPELRPEEPKQPCGRGGLLQVPADQRLD